MTMKFLNIPFLALIKIITFLDYLTLFDLSTVSKRCLCLIQRVKINVDQFIYIIKSDEMLLRIVPANDKLPKFDFKINFSKNPTKSVQCRKVGNSHLALSEIKLVGNYCGEVTFESEIEDGRLEILEILSRHFQSFMKVVRLTCLEFGVEIGLKDLFVWNLSKKFQLIEILKYGEREPLELTPEELCYLLEDVEMGTLILNVITSDPNFKFRNRSIADSLTISNTSWVDFEMPLVMDNRILHFYVDKTQTANILLKSWINGDHDNMESLRVEFRIFYIGLDEYENVVLNGITTTESVFTYDDVRSRHVCRPDLYALDIRRAKDGLQATLLGYATAVILLVWKEELLRAIGKL